MDVEAIKMEIVWSYMWSTVEGQFTYQEILKEIIILFKYSSNVHVQTTSNQTYTDLLIMVHTMGKLIQILFWIGYNHFMLFKVVVLKKKLQTS